MVTKRSLLNEKIGNMSTRAVTSSLNSNTKKKSLAYSARKGILYSLVFSILLWWIPIAGPAAAGYISGRKSGNPVKALHASLITTAVFVLLAYLLIPFNANGLGLVGRYLESGVGALAQSKLFAGSAIIADLYSGYGLIRTFTLILPSSILTLISFSYAGGVYSELTGNEEGLRESFNTRIFSSTYQDSRNSPRIELEDRNTRGLQRWGGYQPQSYEDSGLDWHTL
jgi:MFS family permease